MAGMMTVMNGYCELVEIDLRAATIKLAQLRVAQKRSIEILREGFNKVTAQANGDRFDLNVVVAEIVESIRSVGMLGPKVTVCFSTADERKLIVHGKSGWLFQALMNLAINAGQAMPAGGTLEFRSAIGDEGKSADLWVIDSGCGLAPELVQTIWNRIANDRSEHGHGLIIVKSRIERLSGVIWATSELGVGTKFLISLPLAVA